MAPTGQSFCSSTYVFSATSLVTRTCICSMIVCYLIKFLTYRLATNQNSKILSLDSTLLELAIYVDQRLLLSLLVHDPSQYIHRMLIDL